MGFERVSALLRDWVARGELPCASYAVLRGSEVVTRDCIGWADREAGIPLRPDHLLRAFSNTKLVTSCAALQLLQQGRFALDDPIGEYIPQLAQLRVLRAGATDIHDTEPAREPVRIRHLLTHTAGFTYAFTRPDAPIAKAYLAARVSDPALDLSQMMDALASVPLVFQPGSAWNYSVAIDVVGRLVEVLGGERLDAYLQRHVFDPLGMQDTFFFVPPGKQDRLVAMYMGSQGGRLRRVDQLPYADAYRKPVARLNPGGGLVTSLGDYTTLVRTLLGGGAPLLGAAMLPLVTQNQLPAGMWIEDPVQEGRGHSFAASVTVHPNAADPGSEAGDVQWGGLAGTKWMFSPREDFGAVLMTQRYMGFDLPYWGEFKQAVRAALS
ncbi:MAG TPA: serine hydrolase domain-containing protein [Ramlibacter sp.]|jgi:CubicO group peptidase (beta-lactamase class C family)|nr:serine hydrolase domain-containing protein [Ramlibacter sp.]